MSEEIRVVYEDMDAMSKTFRSGAEQLKDTMSEMQSIAGVLEDGALLGQGGDAFVQAIRGKLMPAINRLAEKFEELDGDVQAAVRFAREADRTAKGLF
jgi:WXG100 family type VII secretion target